MNSIVSFILGFIGIGVMVSVHELGHFLAAKASGITVEVFALGWGKPIFRWQRGDTEFRINVFPIGGYCRLKGSDDLERALVKDDKSFTNIEDGSLFAATPLKRIFTYVAGPLANIVFAIIIFVPFFLIGSNTLVDPNRVVVTSDYPSIFSISEDNLVPAAIGGIKTGDTILSVDGFQTPNFKKLQEILASRPRDKEATFIVLREQVRMEFNIEPIFDSTTNRSIFGLSPFVEPVIVSVDSLSPEAIAGLTEGDRIVSMQGRPVNNSLDIVQILSHDISTIEMEFINTKGLLRTIKFIPLRSNEGEIILNFSLFRNYEYQKGQSFINSIGNSIRQTISVIGATYALIPNLFSGMFSFDEVLAGPFRLSYVIGDMTGTSMRSGFLSGLRMVFYLFGMVSVSLAVANLLPIPALDGGLIFVCIIEIIRGKTFSPRVYARIQTIGVICIVCLMFIALIGDFRFFLR